jgi:hypothetical protein
MEMTSSDAVRCAVAAAAAAGKRSTAPQKNVRERAF